MKRKTRKNVRKMSKEKKNTLKALVYRYIAEQLSEQALYYFRASSELETNKAITKKNGKIYIDLKKLNKKKPKRRKRGAR